MDSTDVKRICLAIGLLLAVLHTGTGYKILLVPAMPTSHILEFVSLGRALTDKGHQAAIVVGETFPKIKTLTDAGLEVMTFHVPRDGRIELYGERYAGLRTETMMDSAPSLFTDQIDFITSSWVLRDCADALDDLDLLSKLSRSQFDLAVVDGFSLSHCPFLLPYKLGIPFVYAYSGGVIPLSLRIPSLPSFVPNVAVVLSDKMSFIQRFINFVVYLPFEYNIMVPFEGRTNRSLLRAHAPEVKHWDALMRQSLMFFIFKDHHLEYNEPSMPNVIRTPGITIRDSLPLSPAFQALVTLPGSNGVVLVSFGSLISQFPGNILSRFLFAFGSHDDMTFIWKLSQNTIDQIKDEVPANVYLRTWLPQVDLLGHERTRLFITHGGNNGQWESIYHGVPMICIPIFAEQPHNCRRVTEKGYGVTLALHLFSAQELSSAIRAVIGTESYSTATQRISRILKTRPRPTDVVIGWLEHVIEFGAEHLRSPAIDMSFAEFLMLDVILGLYILVAVLIMAIVFSCRKIYSKCKPSKKSEKND